MKGRIFNIGVTFLLLLINQNLFAQGNFTFGVRGGVLFSDAIGNTIDYGGESSIFNPFVGQPINLRNDENRVSKSFYYGLVIERKLNSRLDLAVELNSYELGTNYHSIATNGSATQTFDQELSIEVLNIPIYISYSWDKSISVRFSGGSYINFIRNASYYYHQEQSFPMNDPITNTIIYDLTERINKTSFGMLLKINVSKKVLDKLSVGIEGLYNRDLTYLDKKENRDDSNAAYAKLHAYGIGLQVFYAI